MTYDDGIMKFYNVKNIGSAAEEPVKGLVYNRSLYFAFYTVGYSRFYEALKNDRKIDAVIEIWHDPDIHSDQIVIDEAGKQYSIIMIQTVIDEDGNKMMRISLEGVNDEYQIIEES